MLDIEPVYRPVSANERDGLPQVWGKTYSPQEIEFLAAMGPGWLDKVNQIVALLLSESGPKDKCSVWVNTAESVDHQGLGLFFVFHGIDGVADCLDRLAGDLVGKTPPCSLPSSAVPVLLRRADGTLVRLWEPPGPHQPKKQQMKVEWGEFEFHHRCYKIRCGDDDLSEQIEMVRAALRRWDPIGVHPDWPECPAKDEYDSYAPQILGMLKRGATESELTTHLRKLRTERMGLPAHDSSDEATARELLEGWRESR